MLASKDCVRTELGFGDVMGRIYEEELKFNSTVCFSSNFLEAEGL